MRPVWSGHIWPWIVDRLELRRKSLFHRGQSWAYQQLVVGNRITKPSSAAAERCPFDSGVRVAVQEWEAHSAIPGAVEPR